jgi:hypothetical protein
MSEEGTFDLAVDNLGNGMLLLPLYSRMEHRISQYEFSLRDRR